MLCSYRYADLRNPPWPIFTDSQLSDWLGPPFAFLPPFHLLNLIVHVQHSIYPNAVLFLPFPVYFMHFDEVCVEKRAIEEYVKSGLLIADF